MEGAYWVAWVVLYVFGIALITLCVYPFRRRFYLAFFIAGMGVVWMLVPIPFDEVNWSPLFVALVFQVLIDPDASYAFSATAALLGSATIIAATLLLYGFGKAYKRVADATRTSLRSSFLSTLFGARKNLKAGSPVNSDTST